MEIGIGEMPVRDLRQFASSILKAPMVVESQMVLVCSRGALDVAALS